MHWHGRLRHLLSDLEWGAQLFGLMPAGVEDSMEQVPLALELASHPLLGWIAAALVGALVLTAAILALREIVAYARLAGLGRLRAAHGWGAEGRTGGTIGLLASPSPSAYQG